MIGSDGEMRLRIATTERTAAEDGTRTKRRSFGGDEVGVIDARVDVAVWAPVRVPRGLARHCRDVGSVDALVAVGIHSGHEAQEALSVSSVISSGGMFGTPARCVRTCSMVMAVFPRAGRRARLPPRYFT